MPQGYCYPDGRAKKNSKVGDSGMSGHDIASIRVKDIDPEKLKAVASEISSSLYPSNDKEFIDSTSEQDRISFCVKLNTEISKEFFSQKGMKLIHLSKTQKVELLPMTVGEKFAKEWWQKKLGKDPSQKWIDCCMYYSLNLLVAYMEKREKQRGKQEIPKELIEPAVKFMLDLGNFTKSQMLLSRKAIAEKFKNQ